MVLIYIIKISITDQQDIHSSIHYDILPHIVLSKNLYINMNKNDSLCLGSLWNSRCTDNIFRKDSFRLYSSLLHACIVALYLTDKACYARRVKLLGTETEEIISQVLFSIRGHGDKFGKFMQKKTWSTNLVKRRYSRRQ